MDFRKETFSGGTGGVIIEGILSKAPAKPRTNADIPRDLEEIIGRALEKDCNRRYQTAQEIRDELQNLKRRIESGHSTAAARAIIVPASARYRWMVVTGSVVAAAALVLGGWLYYTRRANALNETDTLLLADFVNKTGDPVFDDTLRQGLAIQLEQSPFLSLVSEQRARDTLRMMDRPVETKLTPEVARDLCQRAGSKAYLTGSISSLGTQYVIGIRAVNCETGDTLVQEQAAANNKEHVLRR